MVSCKATQRLKKILPLVKNCRDKNGGLCKLHDEEAIFGDKMLGRESPGIHRHAYFFTGQKGSSCVVKVPIQDNSRTANITEIESYKKMPNDVKKYFLEISDYDKKGDWLTQPKVVTMRERGYNSSDRIMESFRNNIYLSGVRCSDLHRSNIGVPVNKRVTINNMKILDYGFGVCYKDKTLSNKHEIEDKQYKRKIRRSSSSSERTIQPEMFKIFN